MGRISKSAGAAALLEIRPKFSWGVSIRCYCLSPAPQAVPQAAFLSAGLSAAPQAVPQAVPQAAGFSAGLSAAPQAEPQAAGFSAGLSAVPQAVPQAAGFSAGLSPAPQAVPQAAAGAEASVFLCQPKRLESAILLPPDCIQRVYRPSVILILLGIFHGTSTHYFITQSPFGNYWARRLALAFFGVLHYNKNITFKKRCYIC